jgi:hypothetical protein
MKPLALVVAALAVLAAPVQAQAAEPARCGLDTLPATATGTACLGCHAKDEGAPLILSHVSHPVDVDYRLTRRRASPLRAAPAALSRGVIMPGSRVTCLSCHSSATRARYRLRLPMEDGPVASRLCNACHVMPGDEDGLVAMGSRF